ncbi:MAG: APC family permease [Candidatus Bathyarchaeota archaeon]|nr:MAG: APC family permease [Candidatus Bathyarchaeota archaeon]
MLADRKLGGLLYGLKLALGAAIGYEIFVYLGPAYELAGSVIISAIIVSGLLNLLTMFSYCELAGIVPKEGGEYTYARTAFGDIVGFTTGCIRWLSSVIGGALAAGTFTLIFLELALPSFYQFGVQLPTEIVYPLIAVAIIWSLGRSSIRGSKRLGLLILGSVLIFFAIYALSGFWYLQREPTAPPQVLPTFSGMPRFLLAIAFVLQLFIGMRATVARVPQMKDPEKNAPRTFILATLVLLIVYCAVVYVGVTVVPPNGFFLKAAADKIFPLVNGIPMAGVIIAVIGMIVCLSGISSALMVQSSILSGMSRDGFLPKIVSSTSQSGTHRLAIIISSLSMVMFSVVPTMAAYLAVAAVLLNIMVFMIVNLSVISLRIKKPHRYRPFKAPFYPFSPISGIVVSLGLFASVLWIKETSFIDIPIFGGLMGMVFLSYYLRKIGLNRLKVATGGITLGFGGFTILLSYLIHASSEWPFGTLVPRPFTVFALAFAGVLSIIAGILNVNTRMRKNWLSHPSPSRKHLSHLTIVTGILICLLSPLSLLISSELLSIVILGIVGPSNLIFGVLLLEK